MSKHTPGPWLTSPADKWASEDGTFVQYGRYDISAGSADQGSDDYYLVASVSNVNNSEQNEANARLIAAAPEMLEAGTDLLFFLATLTHQLGLDAAETELTLRRHDGTVKTMSLRDAAGAWADAVPGAA